MRHVHHEIRVDAPVKHVYELACDGRRLPAWNPYQRLDDVHGPIDHPGTTFATTLWLVGHEVHAVAVVTEVVPHRLVRIHATTEDGRRSEWAWRFDPDGEATRLSLEVAYDAPGIGGAIADTLVWHGALERAVRHMLENLAALAEAHAPVLA